jgi:transcriptional regulator of acetoin/glycerol metabolism
MKKQCGTRDLNLDKTIVNSWKRSLVDYGLDPRKPKTVNILSASEMLEELQRHQEYLNIARQGVSGLSNRISDAGFSVVLTDEAGITLDTKLPENYKNECQDSGLRVGAIWSEKQVGTNGIGTCLVEGESLIVHQHEHFFTDYIELSCSCTPIFDPLGYLKGCLNASRIGAPKDKQSQFLTLQLVQMYGRMIENSFFRQSYRNQITMKIRPLKRFSDLVKEQLIALNEKGVIIGANRSAFVSFSQSLPVGKTFLGSSIESIINMSIDELMTQSEGGRIDIKAHCEPLFEEVEISLRVSFHKINTSQKPDPKVNLTQIKMVHPSLEQLAGKDASAQQQVKRLIRVIDKDIPILITGETGTGKEAFARAIHDVSSRSEAPFIALNCAAIPESLIESELFGYRSGTFTGANKKGMKGKLELADGGTLFLDEIGDMPVELQTRLLRVLAERETLPLGASEPVSIDVQVISATHQNLHALINKKLFREDFYYRLNGMLLALPALRNRSDKSDIIGSIIKSLQHPMDLFIDEAARAILDQYEWPGNIRQLKSALKYAAALSDNGNIDVSCLPPEVLAGDELYQIHDKPSGNIREKTLLSKSADNQEGALLLETLKRHRWNITQVADELNICRSTVYRKMQKYKIVQPNEIY